MSNVEGPLTIFKKPEVQVPLDLVSTCTCGRAGGGKFSQNFQRRDFVHDYCFRILFSKLKLTVFYKI